MGKEKKLWWALDPRNQERTDHVDTIQVTILQPSSKEQVRLFVLQFGFVTPYSGYVTGLVVYATYDYNILLYMITLFLHDINCAALQEEELEVDVLEKAMDYKILEPGKFMCVHCLKIYKQLSSLTKHLAKNHNISESVELKCPSCLKVLPTQKKMTHHGNCKKWLIQNIFVSLALSLPFFIF